MEHEQLSRIHREYTRFHLDQAEIEKHPLHQFEKWHGELISCNFSEDPTEMMVATASADGHPSARMVLLKDYGKNGFIFYSNYDSRKGKQLLENPFAAMLFFWPKLEREVRIEGKVLKLDKKESEEYFHSRPFESQVATHVSHQSDYLDSRLSMIQLYKQLLKKFKHKSVPRPPYWGGYRLIPFRYEFWQGREHRLHDRFLYELVKEKWHIHRLNP